MLQLRYTSRYSSNPYDYWVVTLVTLKINVLTDLEKLVVESIKYITLYKDYFLSVTSVTGLKIK